MIFKDKDSTDSQIRSLELALARSRTPSERRMLEKESAIVRAGAKGEHDVAYLINFELASNQNWAVIHDLRIECKGRVAQIDHLLIDRVLEMFVVESKSFRTKVRYAHGGWERLNFNHWEGIPSPVMQNDRHIAVLKDLIATEQLAPLRLGLRMSPTCFNVVAVQPSCSIIGEHPEDAHILRADELVRKIRSQDPSNLAMLKLISRETLHSFAGDLVAHHRPAIERVYASEVLAESPMPAGPPPVFPGVTLKCQCCTGPLSEAEERYCRAHAQKFGSQLLCRKCQKAPMPAPKQPGPETASAAPAALPPVARCAECGAGVDSKVVAYCRFNSKRFSGRTLCRTCQQAALIK